MTIPPPPAEAPRPLPDTLDVAMGRRMAAAHAAGDAAGVERARDYLVREGSTTAVEQAFVDQFTRALVAVQQAMTARTSGDADHADDLMKQVARDFPREMLEQVQQAMLFAAGRRQGWLPEPDYDALAARLPATGEVAELFRHVRRGRPG